MPSNPSTSTPARSPARERFAAFLAAYMRRLHRERYESALHDFRSGFRRSAKGNLWRHYRIGSHEVTLTVFCRPDRDAYAWCVASSGGPRFSPEDFDSEDEALEGLAAEVGADGTS